MASGDLIIFNESKRQIGAEFDLSNPLDFKVMLIDSIPGVADIGPGTGNYVEVAPLGAVYQAGGLALATTWSEASGIVTHDSTINPIWEKDLTGPENIRAALLYSISALGPNALGFVDMTQDGSTPLTLRIGRVAITWNLLGIFSIT